MKEKKIIALLLTFVMALSLIACSKEETTGTVSESQQETEGKTYKIGFAQCTLNSPFYVSMKDQAEAYAKEKGIEFVYADAQEDVTKQNTDVQDLISSDIDALILNPVNSEGLIPAVEACKAANIPVITVDRNVKEGYTAYVGRDNKEMGRLVGEALLKALGGPDDAKGTILEIQGTAGDTVMMARRDGFEEVFKDVSGIKIVQSSYCDYTRSKAVVATQDLVQSHKDIVAIYGHNDDMSLGALQVLEENGIENVKVTGVDGLMEAVLKMEEGSYDITAMNDPGSLATAAIDTAIKILNEEDYEEYVDAGTGIIDANNVKDFVNPDQPFAGKKNN